MKRRGRKSAAQTPAPKNEQVYGSKTNPKGSAASEKSASKIKLSSGVLKTLKDKVEKYNKTHTKDVSLSTTKAVMRRGMGAYSKSHRPTITGGAPNSRQAWGFARVNKFLKKKSGQKVKKAYVQDDDLMAEGGVTNGDTESSIKKFYDWYTNWYKSISNKMNIVIAIPNGLVEMPSSFDPEKTIRLDLFEKIDQNIDAKPYLKRIIDKADELGLTIYLEAIPRYKHIKDSEKREKITKNYLKEYYSNFGFKPIADAWMKRVPKNPDINHAKGGDLSIGRLAKGMTLKDIADHHKIKVSELEPELKLGIKTEMEHTYDPKVAKAIAFDHLFENPKYYTELSEMEMKAEGKKLEDYYASGGNLVADTCKEVDSNGEALTDKDSLKRMTQCLENLPQTKSLHFDPQKNDYTPERKKLHRQIILEAKKDLICIENAEPIAILMGGSPASGKSTFLKKYAPYLLKTEILKIDADEIRSKLPEYKGYNATQTHLETKDIVNTLLSDRNIGIPCRFDVIYDGTMNNTKSYLPLINLLKSLGYRVFIVYIDKVPKEVVIRRSLERYKKSGRFVPLEVIDDFFDKGTEALEKLKSQVDGYMIVDGSDMDYKIIERGGMKLPKNRNYSKIGEPISITDSEIVSEFKKGGEINPDNPKLKSQITHKSGSVGGLLVGNRHSEGGIKAINKSTNQPLEMEGGEVVITRDAVSDNQKREFEGEMLTNREILSRINQSGGGVAFAEGGDVPEKCSCSGKHYKYGGKLLPDMDIVNDIMDSTRKRFGIQFPDLLPSEAFEKIFEPFDNFEEGGELMKNGDLLRIINKRIPSLKGFADMNKEIAEVAMKGNYIEYLKSKFDIDFYALPQALRSALLMGNQKLIDNYINN